MYAVLTIQADGTQDIWGPFKLEKTAHTLSEKLEEHYDDITVIQMLNPRGIVR